MLNRIIIHHKNIIFFKIVITVLITIALIAIIPCLEENYENKKIKFEQSKASLFMTTRKLKSLNQFDNSEYFLHSQDLESGFLTTKSCKKKINLIHSIENLSKKYDFLDVIKITTLPISGIDYHINIPLGFNLISYEMSVKFEIHHINEYFHIINEIRKLLPLNSIISEMTVNYDPAITPQLVHLLKEGKNLPAYKIVIKILIRELSNDK